MFSKRSLRKLCHSDRIKIIKEMRKQSLSYLNPCPRFFPLFLYKFFIKKTHNVSKKQLTKIK